VKKKLSKMTLSRETLRELDTLTLRIVGGLDTDKQCVPLTEGTCNIPCASMRMYCEQTYSA
jgi:hypothetical protein